MQNIHLYKLAFELFIESTVNHQKLREASIVLVKISEYLDTFFHTKFFSCALEEKAVFYKNLLLNEDESLFIQESHIPYLIKSEKLCTDYDKLMVYIIIQGWVNEFSIPNELIYRKIAFSLSLDQSSIDLINSFIHNSGNIEKNENYLLLKPETKIEQEKLEGEWIEENKPENLHQAGYLVTDKLNIPIQAVFISSNKGFLIKCSHAEELKPVKNDFPCPDKFCFIQSGDTISIDNEAFLNFADLKKKYVEKKYSSNFFLTALLAEQNSPLKKRIRPFNFIGQPGELIGLVGREGSGKSSILEMLAGIQNPEQGTVFLNGYDIYKNSYQLSGFIGYVSEEDLLYQELTARENLIIAGELYLSKISLADIKVIVDNLLVEMDLWDIRDEKVGKSKEKNIQPGQRRLLNIALELIREPHILIIDNAVSALSLSDSSKVIEVLTRFTFKGKLIITSITQTSTQSFEYFDKLLILGEKGTTVFFGQRQNALTQLLKFLPEGISHVFSSTENFSCETLLNLIGRKKTALKAHSIQSNYIDTEKLYDNYLMQPINWIERTRKRKKIPRLKTQTPRLERQYFIYCIRNFKTKLAKRKELYYTIFAAPLMGLIISLILRSSDGDDYTFGTNPNVPAFFLLSILICFFFGLSLSAREIIREQYVLKRERHLNLSLFSYINSKITYLLILTSIQSLLFVLITNLILKIEGLLLTHWIIYFSISSCGSLLGLLFSSTHKSLDSIVFRSVPITMVILLIFSGGFVPVKNLNASTGRYTPLLCDLFVTRWAYEAILVEQYISNPYQKKINDVEQSISVGSFNSFHVLPKFREYIEQINNETTRNNDTVTVFLKTISNRFEYYTTTEDVFAFEYIDNFKSGDINSEIISEALDYLSYLEYFFSKKYNEGLKQKASITDSINSIPGATNMEALKFKHQNIYLTQMLRNSSSRESYKIYNNRIIQLSDPVYQKPENNFGRSQFFIAQKRFNNQVISTFLFDVSIIWLLIFVFYILLITNMVNHFVLFIKRN